jgi:hypothetical protein
MRTSAKLITALSVAGLIGIAGSAFTATSTIDAGQKYVGAKTQSISGVAISSVEYTTDVSTDVTTGVSFHVTQNLGSETTITATISKVVNTVTTEESDECDATPVANGGGTNLVCDFGAGVSDVRSLEIVAS